MSNPKSNLMLPFLLVMIISCFSTAAFADDLSVFAYRDDYQTEARPGMWTLRIQFNKPVFGSNLAQALTVNTGGHSIQTELLDTQGRKFGNDGLTEFHLVPKQPVAALAPVILKIRKGFTDTSGRSRLGKEFSYTFLPAQEVSVTEVEPYYSSKKDRGILVTLSDFVEKSDIEKSLKIQPHVSGVKFTRDNGRKYKISGDFKLNESYTLESVATSVNSGRSIMEANKFSFNGPGLTRQITSQTTANVVELKSRQLFPLQVSGVTTMRAELTRIPAIMVPDLSDIVASGEAPNDEVWKWVRDTYRTLDSNGFVNKQFLGEIESSSDAFFSSESRDKTRPYSLPLAFRQNREQGGAWLLQLSDPENLDTPKYNQLVQITDMSISYKLSPKSLLIWVTSINEGLPVPGVDLMVRGKGESTFYIGKTDQNGLLTLKQNGKGENVSDEDGSKIGKSQTVELPELTWVIAATENDSSAIKLDNFRIKPFVWNRQDESSSAPATETGYLFTERGVYRPGEPVNFKFVARIYDKDRILSPKGEKVKAEIISPRGDALYSKELTLNEYGSCFDQFQSQSYMPLGTYTINTSLLNRNQKSKQFSQTFLLQQFKEPRHKVSLNVKTEDKKAQDYVGLDVAEEYLLVDVDCGYYAGGPVRNGRVRWKVDLVPAHNKVKGYDDFFFGNSNTESRFLESGESNLDGYGKLLVRIPLDTRLLTGIYGVKVSVTALDIDGEPATEVMTFNPKPKYLVGLSEHPDQVQSGYVGQQKFVVLGPDGSPVPQAPVQITWLQKRYLYLQKRDDQGNMVDSWEEGWMKNFSSSQSTTDGQGVFQVELNQPGDYMVNVTYEKDQVRYASQTTYSVGWEDYERWMRNQGPGLSKSFGDIVLSLNRKEYQNGETINASSTATKPVRKVLATIERDDVLEAKVVDADQKNINFSFPVSEKFRPNVFVGALAPSGRKGFPLYYNQADTDIPAIYSGYANAGVRSELRKLKIEIQPGMKELKAKPGTSQSIDIVATDYKGAGVKCEMAVCVVNEAVLALTGFKTPDLSSLADFNLALSVFTGDLRVGLVSQDLLKILQARPVTGGGVGSGLVTPSLRKDFRPVAFYSPSVITNDSGEARVSFTLPDSTTAYRVYVVAADQTNGFASAQKNLVASKEFSLEPSTPRFLCHGDKAAFPIIGANATDSPGMVKVNASASENFNVKLKKDSFEVPLQSNASTTVYVEAGSGINEAKVVFTGQLKSADGTYEDGIEKKIPISSKLGVINSSQIGAFTAKTDLKVAFPDYVKAMDRAELTGKSFNASLDLGLTDWARISPSLKYLMTYPFGCIEQTSSAVFPLVAIKNLVTQGVIPEIKPEDLDRFVKSGVERILSMQLSSGAFSYWPRQNSASFWGSVYAAFALEKAGQVGYDVPQASIQKALKYVRDNIFKSDAKADNNEQEWIKGWAILTLAEGKSLSHQDFEPIFKTYGSADEETKALLLLTAQKIGYLPAKKLGAELKALKISDQSVYSGLKGSVSRKQAAQLMATVAIEGHSASADNIAAKLIKGLRPDGSWGSTADSGWSLIALSDYYKSRPALPDANTEITINYGSNETKKVTIGKVGAHVALPAQTLLNKDSITLKSSSGALVNYTLNISYPDKGDKAEGPGSGMGITKKIENVNGKPDIRLGDIVKVTLELNLSDSKAGSAPQIFEYVAIEDFVPAGLFPINSKISTEGVESQPEDESYGDSYNGSIAFIPSHVEFMDEGVRIFKNKAYSGIYRFSYLARAVTEGDFWMRGTRMSLMYEPSRSALIPGGRVTVKPQD